MAIREVQANVRDNPDESRYELFLDGRRVGFLDYHLSPGRIVLPYIEVDSELEGRGLGGELTEAVLNDCRARGLTVVPECPYIVRYFRLHPEHRDLLEDGA